MEREAGHNARARCLLLVSRGQDVPLDLLEGLRRRGVGVREVPDGPAAMLALAADRYTSLILIQPDDYPAAGALIEAVHRYHAATALWQYCRGDEPPLTRCGVAGGVSIEISPHAADRTAFRPLATQSSPPSAPITKTHEPPPPLAGHDELSEGEGVEELGPLSPVTLTPEELAMLLDDDATASAGG